MNRDSIDNSIQRLNRQIAKKHVENEQCRHYHSSNHCYHITIEIKDLHKELEIEYKLYKKETGNHHMQDLPF